MTKILCWICAMGAFIGGHVFTGFLLLYVVFFKEFKE